jgi:hypothetical protein
VSTYFNEKTREDGYVFDSKREAQRYRELRLLVAGGAITDLEVHPSWVLCAGVEMAGKKCRAIRYTGDFSYRDGAGALVVEDVKPRNGYRTPVYKLKKHLMKAIHGIEVQEVV